MQLTGEQFRVKAKVVEANVMVVESDRHGGGEHCSQLRLTAGLHKIM